jgi:hypothetical protein
MIQVAKERMKEISDKQTNAIKKIILCRDFNLAEYRKLKEVLDRRVVTRQDASMFLEYCFAKVRFERYFNGHHHKAYAACCFCKGRDNLRKIENLKTGDRNWCCQTCRSNITDQNIVDMPRVRNRIGEPKKVRADLQGIKSLATDMVLMADDYPNGVSIRDFGQMAEEIMETARNLLRGEPQANEAEIMAQETSGGQIVEPAGLG